MRKSIQKFGRIVIFWLLFGLNSYITTAQASLSSQAATASQIKSAQVKKIKQTTRLTHKKTAQQPKKVVKGKIASASTKKTLHSSSLDQRVLSVYRGWAGTRYRLGGNSKSGIDCSAFVRETAQRALGIYLPRSTAQQKKVGKAIPKSNLKAGDLVFFRKNHHVGIYIGNGKFVHASSSKGVTTSSLNERYWHKHYSQSRRII